MMGKTHMVSAAAAWSGGATFLTGQPHPEALPIVIFASIMPDIDHPNSKMGKRFRFTLIPYILYYIIGHRTITHSLFLLLPMLTAAFYFNNLWLTAFVAGYCLHILGDYIADEGIVFFWPVTPKRYHAFLTFKTNGLIEWLIMIACWIALAWIFQGYISAYIG